jgi:hypothetical protein
MGSGETPSWGCGCGAGGAPAIGLTVTDGVDGRIRPADLHLTSLTPDGRLPVNRYASC